MTTTAPRTRANTHTGATGPDQASSRSSWQRRRHLPWAAAGVVLILGSALIFASLSLRSPARQQVLVVAAGLPAGHVLAAADLQTAALSGSSVASIPAGQEQTVVGRPLAVALQPGSLLTTADVGSAAPVSAGQAVVALALKPGQFPPALGPGDAVEIIDTGTATSDGTGSATATQSTAAVPVAAMVLDVDATPEGSAASEVVSLQLPQTAAAQVATLSAGGEATLVLLPAGMTP
jgi:hypothetical protein